ncbi:MAG TPA: ABC transporter ATP-binding protein [Ohtaekwangia sp.]
MNEDNTILLQTQNLVIGYKDSLLTNLSLQLKAGELLCFMGPNGIGKSTLIRTLAGLQKPLAGDIEGINDSERSKQIALVLTDRINASNMTVKELVSYGRYPYLNWNIQLSENDNTIIQKALDQVRITYLSGKKIHELSDGQLQMVMIARALAQDTSIILLDEPTAHLDLNNRVEIMKLLRTLAHQLNKAVLISTHELDLALQMADVIWITGKEKNIITGIPEDLVLNGTFDDVFQFKGFDLKTGKIQHTIHQQKTIDLSGEGYEYLWTKNALQRNGFELTTQANLKISVSKEGMNTCWNVSAGKSLQSLEELLRYLKEI